MTEDLKIRIHSLTNTLTSILGYLDLEEYDKVAQHVKIAIRDLRQLAKAIEVHVTSRKPQQ